MLSDREDDGRPALGRFHSSCPERAPSQLTVGEISPTGTAEALRPTGRTLNIGEQECHDPRRPAPADTRTRRLKWEADRTRCRSVGYGLQVRFIALIPKRMSHERCVAILRWVLLRRTFETQRPGRTYAVGVRLGRLECGLLRDGVALSASDSSPVAEWTSRCDRCVDSQIGLYIL